jgi:hypothetical protein
MSEAFQEIGPTALARGRVHETAREIEALARVARELSTAGPRCDVARARDYLDRMRAILGGGQ